MTLSLHQKALNCVKNYKQAELELLNILGQIDQDKTYLAVGVSSLFRYCVEILKLSESDTMKFIQVTRKSVEVPELKEAIANGDITTTKASRIASVITPANCGSWIQTAKESNHRELEREIAALNPEQQVVEKIKPVSINQYELKLTLSAELQKKLERLKVILNTNSIQDLLEISVDAMLEKKDPVLKALKSKSRLENEPQISKPINKNESRLANRYIPASIRHQVYLRDRGMCVFKNCGETRYVQIHHRKLLSQGGTHILSNLVTLCSSHHRMLHVH